MEGDLTTLNERYKLIERAGSGGMATVYKAQDLLLGRLVALKILHPNLSHDAAFLRRFQREAHAAASLSHPNIVTVHDIGHDEGPTGPRQYIVMEYVEGRTLKALLREHMEQHGQPLPIARTLDLLIQVCVGIGYAHRANLVHCDVKPQNILVMNDDRVKVADFGIARAVSEHSLHDASMMWGTPHYFAPEQAAGHKPTPAADVYAIGIILFEMLTGRLPFEADTLPGLALKHLQEPPPMISEFNPAIPQQLERIVQKVLSKEPSGRYRTAGQLENILRAYRDSSLQATGPLSANDGEGTDPTLSRPAELGTTRRAVAAAPAVGTHTEVYQRPQLRDQRPPRPEALPVEDETVGTDWGIIFLGLTAVILLLGLIPLWYLVYTLWTG